MNGLLSARLDKLKAAMLDSKDDRPKWVIRIVASDEEEAAAVTLARAEGWDPDGNDICVIRLIAMTASQRERTTSDDRQPPHVMSKNW